MDLLLEEEMVYVPSSYSKNNNNSSNKKLSSSSKTALDQHDKSIRRLSFENDSIISSNNNSSFLSNQSNDNTNNSEYNNSNNNNTSNYGSLGLQSVSYESIDSGFDEESIYQDDNDDDNLFHTMYKNINGSNKKYKKRTFNNNNNNNNSNSNSIITINKNIMLDARVIFLSVAFIAMMGLMYVGTTTSITGNINNIFKSKDNDESTNYNSNKPNIVFILADDIGWNTLGISNDNSELSFTTPFLNGIAAEGIKLKNYYTQESSTPSRAALLTGKYPVTLGMQYGDVSGTLAWGLDVDEITLANVLDNNGYKTYIYGRWDLGHHSPLHLPTARGFDIFLGYLAGDNYYWSKRNFQYDEYFDLTYSSVDEKCYYQYNANDLQDYSTFLYRDHAIDAINSHNISDPMFLYLAFQSAKDPFNDGGDWGFDMIEDGDFEGGMPKHYLTEGVYLKIKNQFEGHKLRQYAMSLSVLDGAIEDIYVALGEKGMLLNTYFIFASDNGGCYDGGAYNGGLRGTSGTLFEGGVKVESFLYSPLISDEIKGMNYENLFHVTDWFPTILSIADISYTPSSGHELDGVNHWNSIIEGSSSPRDYILYNSYTNVEGKDWNIWKSGGFAIRNDKYKLIHTYESKYSGWHNITAEIENDDELDMIGTCSQTTSMDGVYTYYLFDIVNDPYETINLYDSTSSSVENAKTVLYDKYTSFNIKTIGLMSSNDEDSITAWKLSKSYIVPWTNLDSSDLNNCGPLEDADSDGKFITYSLLLLI